ncbi:nucleotidyltransferase family protein [Lacihabitans sp. LS3-19]|nr:nucleotidyltransferase family protein [Lacihabitans sp. LS3-19]
MAGFILAAGLGTRLKPWTDHHPKALAMVNGKSLLQRNIEYLQKFGITDVVVNVHHFADQIIQAIETNKGWGSKISISDETEEVLETGGGLLKAKSLLAENENFVLMNCDILTDLDLNILINQHKENQALATLAVANRETSRYLLFNENQEMVGWKNIKTEEIKLPAKAKLGKTEPTPMAFSGIHVISNAIFAKINLTGKFGMIDLYLDLCADNKIIGYDHSKDLVLDVGKPEAVLRAEGLFK